MPRQSWFWGLSKTHDTTISNLLCISAHCLHTNSGDNSSLENRSSLVKNPSATKTRCMRTLRWNLVSSVGTGALSVLKLANHSILDLMPVVMVEEGCMEWEGG